MNCDVCQDLFQQRLDGREPADPADLADLEGHLRGCPSCRMLHAAACRFQQGLRLLAGPQLPDGLAARVAARLREDYLARRRWRRRLSAGLAVAAAVLLLLSVRLWQGSGEDRRAGRFIPSGQARRLVSPSEDSTPAPAPGAVRESMSEVGSTMVEVAARTADVTVAESRHFLPLLTGSPLGKLQLPVPVEAWSGDHAPTAQVLREAGEEVSGSLAPVAESPRRALDLFLRELPPMNLDAKMGL